MYKRKARLLFISKEMDLLVCAQEQASLFASEWLECEIDLLEEMAPVPKPASALVDVMIFLYREGSMPVDYLGNVPYRRWCLHGAIKELEQQMCRELKSMAAGMTMLSRMDP